MTFTEAAAEVLRQIGRPLHYKEITDLAIEKNLLSHVGKSPEVTMGARLAALMKKETPDCPLVRVKPGVFALRDWDDATIKAGLEPKKGGKKPRSKDDEITSTGDATDEAELDAEPEPDAAEIDDDDEVLVAKPHAPDGRPAPRVAGRTARIEDEEEVAPAGPEDRMRAQLVASAAGVFDEEDDDDQPILGGADEARGSDAGEAEGPGGGRRRRRRRRGRGGAEGGATLPSYTATPLDAARGEAPRVEGPRGDRHDRGDRGDRDRGDRGDRGNDRGDRGNDRIDRAPAVDHFAEGAPNADELTGRDFADSVVQLLTSFDRAAGPVSLRQLAEAAQRRGKVGGDIQALQSMIAAAVRADNVRRTVNGHRPRFRFAGGRVALTDWILGGDLAQAEHEALAAVERYREAARRAFAKRAQDLPGHAFVELCVLLLERLGISQIRSVRRAGVPGSEGHFTAVLKTPADEIRLGVLIRRDGREVGRERVTELRGALHHYGPATMGWILTSGQVLSGAREEADAPGVAPVALTDGLGLAKLCEEHDVAVVRARLPIAIPDVDLFEALRAS